MNGQEMGRMGEEKEMDGEKSQRNRQLRPAVTFSKLSPMHRTCTVRSTYLRVFLCVCF